MWLSLCIGLLLLFKHKIISGVTIIISGTLFQSYFIVVGGVIWTIVGLASLAVKNIKAAEQEKRRKEIEARLEMVEREANIKLEEYNTRAELTYCFFCGGECFVYSHASGAPAYICLVCNRRFRHTDYEDGE